MIVQGWRPDIKWNKQKVKRIPIWVEFHGLDFKYWGEKSMSKIVGAIRKYLKSNRENLMYGRVLIEVEIDQFFPKGF